MTASPNLRELARKIHNGESTAADLAMERLELARASESVFTLLNENVVQEAEDIDRKNSANVSLPSLSGVPVSLKDLFDVKGEPTLAGSVALKNVAEPAQADCDVVASLRNAGLLFLGRTNMSEFAFSGMGLNPHYGTPKCIWDRETGRLPGGSSSGSAVSVAEGIVPVTMGSDTAGSCRIPAAFNGIVGVKPSYGRFSLSGIFPLSPTSDAPGPLGVDVDSCFVVDRILTGIWDGYGEIPDLEIKVPGSLVLVVPESIVMEGLDDTVAEAFHRAVTALDSAGAKIIWLPVPVVDDCVDMFLNRPVAVFEAWEHHQPLIEIYGGDYDDYVRRRIESGREVTEEDKQARFREKAGLKQRFGEFMDAQQAHAILYPTVACVPPTIEETMVPENTARINLRCLRNTSTANYFDGCSVSLPINREGEAPVGLMLSSAHGRDDDLYRVAASVENVINRER